MLGDRPHDLKPFIGLVNFPDLSEGLVHIRHRGDQWCSFPDRAAQGFPVERISPAVVTITGAASLLEHPEEMNGLRVVAVFFQKLREERKSHRIVGVRDRKSLALPEYAP